MIVSNMAAPQATSPRMGAAFLVVVLVGLLGFALEDSCAKFSYDKLHAFTGIQRNATADSPVVIVYLDLQAYLSQHRDPTQLWPRELHAQLVRPQLRGITMLAQVSLQVEIDDDHRRI